MVTWIKENCMRRNFVFAALCCLLFFCGCYSASKIVIKEGTRLPEDKRLKVAVVDFTNQSGEPAYDALMAGITANFLDELQKTGNFRLIERKHMETVLAELKLNMSGLVEPGNAKQIGKQLGVDAFVFGSLSSVKYSKNKQTILIMWTEGQKTDIALDARIVNVETGEIISSSKATAYVKQRSWVAFWFAKIGKISEKNSIVRDGTDLACRQVANDLSSQIKEK